MSLLQAVGAFLVVATGIAAWRWGVSARRAKSDTVDVAASRSTLEHLNAFFLGIALVLVFVVGMVLISGAVYPWLRDGLFSDAPDGKGLQVSDFLSILALLSGVPLAFAGSIYAIYLAILGLRGSSDQKRLAMQANKFSDPAYELSQRAYNGYRRFGFLVGALLASSRIEKQALNNAQYEQSPEIQKGAASQIVLKLLDLLFDEAFSIAALEAARSHGRAANAIDERTAEHQLRSNVAHLIGLLGGLDNRPLDAAAMSPVMAGVYLLDRQIRLGRQAVVAEVGDKRFSESDQDDERFLFYLSQWMGRTSDAETGGDLQRNAQATLKGDLQWKKKFETPEILVSRTLTAMLKLPRLLEDVHEDDRKDIGAKTSRQVPIAPAMRVRAAMGDFLTLGEIERLADQMAAREGLAVKCHPFNQVVIPEDWKNSEQFQVISCDSEKLRDVVSELPLGSGFMGILIVDGIRSSKSIELEKEISAYEDSWANAREGNQSKVAPTRAVVMLDVIKGVTAVDRLQRSDKFCSTYGKEDPLGAARLLMVGIDYFELRPEGDRSGVDPLLHIEHIFAQGGAVLTEDIMKIAGLEVAKSSEL